MLSATALRRLYCLLRQSARHLPPAAGRHLSATCSQLRSPVAEARWRRAGLQARAFSGGFGDLGDFLEEPKYLDGLNDEQRQVVLSPYVPLRVLAGPGSGKTRALVARVVHLIHQGALPSQIVCVTFTKKAAGELKERLGLLVGPEVAKAVTFGTFHSLAALLLRQHIHLLPQVRQNRKFSIYDTDDSQSVVRGVLVAALEADGQKFEKDDATKYCKLFSEVKNAVSCSYQLSATAALRVLKERGHKFVEGEERYFPRIWDAYEQALAASNALDFDDLVSWAVALLRDSKHLARRLAERWPFVLVDEFQDSNFAQYELINLLAATPGRERWLPNARSLLVVGDSDQSIYGWRGAQEALLRTRLGADLGHSALHLSLTSNYRSTPQILSAADALLDEMVSRSELRVRPVLESGAPVELWDHASCSSEPPAVADEIQKLMNAGVEGHEIAILYRANFMSRAVEDELVKRKIKYVIVGGLPFFGRREVKDLISLLRLIANPTDYAAFRRMVNTPSRGIGDSTIEKLRAWAELRSGNVDAAGALLLSHEGDLPPAEEMGLPKKAYESVTAFRNMYTGWKALAETATVADLLRAIMEDIDYLDWLLKDAETFDDRSENVEELLNLAVQYSGEKDDPATGSEALLDFLSDAALMSDVETQEEGSPGCVRLMTMHGSKGLEFHAVFAIGLEDGIIPSARSNSLDEERRLLYVTMTRAQQRLYLSHAKLRFKYGETSRQRMCEFLKQVEERGELVPRSFALDEAAVVARWARKSKILNAADQKVLLGGRRKRR